MINTRRRLATLALATVGVVLAGSGTARADTSYDLYTIASGYTAAPDGAYTYFQVPTGQELQPGDYTPVTNVYSDQYDHGFEGTDSGFPFFTTNTNSSDSVQSNGVVIPAHSFFFHPGPSTAGVTAFVVPGGGAATVSATVTLSSDDSTTRGNSVNGYLFAADASGAVIGGTPTPTLRPRSGSVTLSLPATALPAGGHVFLVVDNNDDYSYDSTGVAMDVTADGPAAPLPESPLALGLPLAGLGVATVAVVSRRRRPRFGGEAS